MELEPGEAIEEENITMIHNGKLEKFASIEEFLEKENLDIFYPQPLPSGLEVKTIRKYSFEDENYSYIIDFNKPNTSLMIRNYFAIDTNSLNFKEKQSFAQSTFYIVQNENNTYQAICQKDKSEYVVNAPDYETLISLLQNLKGSPK